MRLGFSVALVADIQCNVTPVSNVWEAVPIPCSGSIMVDTQILVQRWWGGGVGGGGFGKNKDFFGIVSQTEFSFVCHAVCRAGWLIRE